MGEKRHKHLVRLIRRIAREEAYQVLDEHMEGYERRETPAEGRLEREKKREVTS